MDTSTISLRHAGYQDLPLLKHWDEQPHVKAALGDDDDDWEWGKELQRTPEWREFLIAELVQDLGAKRPVGFMQIIDPALEDSHYWGDVGENLRAIDIWIGESSDLGLGYGTQMMKLAFERCFADPEVTEILIDPLASNTRARKFYQRLGFEFVEQRVFDEEECAVYSLARGDALDS